MKKILDEQRIVARDQNKVFVERAEARRLSSADAEMTYGLEPGKGNAYVEFDIEESLLGSRANPQTKIREFFIVGDVALENRNAKALVNF